MADLGLHLGDEVILRLLLPGEIARFAQGFGEPDGGFARVHVVGITRAPAWGDPVTGLSVTPAFVGRTPPTSPGRAVLRPAPLHRPGHPRGLHQGTGRRDGRRPDPLAAGRRVPPRADVPDLRGRPDGAGRAARPAGRARRVRGRGGAGRAARRRAGTAAPSRRAARRAAHRARARADAGRAGGRAGAGRSARGAWSRVSSGPWSRSPPGWWSRWAARPGSSRRRGSGRRGRSPCSAGLGSRCCSRR